ncbi:MAG: HAD family hydrolase [Lachnospiraceae bacterium]|nr:HAD family hydrolase [Lachnospiraceae bacterium]
MKYKNYIFDLYGTLVDIHTNEHSVSLWRRMADIYRTYGCDCTAASLSDRFWKLEKEKRVEAAKRLKVKLPEIRLEEVFLELLLEMPKRKDGALLVSPETWSEKEKQLFVYQIANTFRILSRTKMKLFPGTLKTLEMLHKEGCKVYLLSNAQKIFTWPELETLGLVPYFDDIFISSDEDLLKPEKEFLERLMKKHDMKKKESVMIGNEPGADLEIAKRCGISGILVHPGESIADVVI